MDYMTHQLLGQLNLKEMREFHMLALVKLNKKDNDEELKRSFESWRKFVDYHSQLEVMHIEYPSMKMEHLQITLENLSSLKSLEFHVRERDFLSDDTSDDFFNENKMEQAENIAYLIGEKYDRLEHLKMDFHEDVIRNYVLNYLSKFYPTVKLNK